MSSVLQLFGAVLILVPFAWAQLGGLSPLSVAYLVLNLVGSALLAVIALDGHQWGFLLLEISWVLVSAVGLLNRRRGRPRTRAH